MLDAKVTKRGTLIYHNGKISIDGWRASEPVMCREMAILACLHVAQTLLKEASAGIGAPGVSKVCVDVDLNVLSALVASTKS